MVVEAGGERRTRFLAVVGPHLEALRRTALRMTGAAERADDAVQETCLRAWRYFDALDPSRSARVWLFAILRNAIYDAGRRAGRERAASLDRVGAESVAAPRRQGTPEGLAEDREILEAIDGLPEDLRAVVLMAVVEGMKYREVAEALEIPVGTVMSRLWRGRQLLRVRLRSYLDDGDGGERAAGEQPGAASAGVA